MVSKAKAFSLSALVAAFLVALFLYAQSTVQYKLAATVLEGPQLEALAGKVSFSLFTAFRIASAPQQSSRFSFYVSGSRQSGWLVVTVNNGKQEPSVEAAIFSGRAVELSTGTSVNAR
jgi:hypothetical protein